MVIKVKRYLYFLAIIFLFFSISVYGAPSPWGIALNYETHQCAGFWAGDEYASYYLPKGWKAYYPDYKENLEKNKKLIVETEYGQCDFSSRNYKECCDNLGFVFVADNVGQKLAADKTDEEKETNSAQVVTGSNEDKMKERYMEGSLSKDEMRAMIKSKLGDKFSEEDFQRGMMGIKERMNRQDAFSYEHEAYANNYNSGPSYEGYSKEQIIFGIVFEQIGDDIDPREIKTYCNDTSKIADIVIEKLKEKVGDLQKICSRMEDNEAKCIEMSKKSCSQIGNGMMMQHATEMEKTESAAYSCPVDKDAVIKACKIRSKGYMEKHIFKHNQICDKDKYIQQCKERLKAEHENIDESTKCPEIIVPTCESNRIAKKYTKDGCSFYSCEAPCPQFVMPRCTIGTTFQEKNDDKGCKYYYCEKDVNSICGNGICEESEKYTCPQDCERTLNSCPSVPAPQCKESESIQKKVDDKGCVYYYCLATTTPTITTTQSKTITLSSDKTDGSAPFSIIFKATLNNFPSCGNIYTWNLGDGIGNSIAESCAGAISTVESRVVSQSHTYQKEGAYIATLSIDGVVSNILTIKVSAPTCPTVSKPTCGAGQSLTTKYNNNKCIVGYECISTTANGSVVSITGNLVLQTDSDASSLCENSWLKQENICSNSPFSKEIEKHCESEIESQIKYSEHKCARIDEDRKSCIEHSAKRCDQMKGLTQQCKDTLTEEKLRNFIVEEAKKRCKFTGIMQDEEQVRNAEKVEILLAVLNTATSADLDKLKLFVENFREELKLQDTIVYKGTIDPKRFNDIKLLPFVVNAKLSTFASSENAAQVKTKIVEGQKAGEAASKLVSLRDTDLPNQYLYIIEDKASDILNVSEQLNEIDKKEGQKGIGYKVRRFLGFARNAEQEEIKQLQGNKDKLQNSIETLAKLADEVPADVAKAILKEQVENLKKQQQDIGTLIQAKEKKAKGLLGIFG